MVRSDIYIPIKIVTIVNKSMCEENHIIIQQKEH
jgi:hypothetical protein